MALEHARPGQNIDIAPLGAALGRSASHAILKTGAFELMRIVLRSGECLPTHQVPGEATLLCIEGAADVTIDGVVCPLHAHQLVLLPAQVPHAVRALADTSLLLTLQLTAGKPGPESAAR